MNTVTYRRKKNKKKRFNYYINNEQINSKHPMYKFITEVILKYKDTVTLMEPMSIKTTLERYTIATLPARMV